MSLHVHTQNICHVCAFILQITGVMTQGRGDGEEWVTSFMVSYSMDAFHWQYVTDLYSNQRVRKPDVTVSITTLSTVTY